MLLPGCAVSGRTMLSACSRLSLTTSTSIQTWCHSGRRQHSSSGSGDRSSSASTFISNGRLVKNSSSNSSSNNNSSQSSAQSPPQTPLILNINAGLGPKSLVTQASQSLFSSLTFKHDVVEHDLWSDELISYNVSHMAAKMRLLKGKGTPEDEQLFLPIHRVSFSFNV